MKSAKLFLRAEEKKKARAKPEISEPRAAKKRRLLDVARVADEKTSGVVLVQR